MTTIVNNPAPVQAADSSGSGFLIGFLVFIVVVAGFLYFGVPILRNMGSAQINVPAPQINIPAPQVNVPGEIDVNVNQAK